MSLALIENEKIFKKTCPHFLSMFHLYLTWLYIGILGICMIVYKVELHTWLKQSPLGDHGALFLYWLTWSLLILIPAVLVSFLRLNWYWLLLGILLCSTGMITHKQRDSIAQPLRAYWEASPILKSYVQEWETKSPFLSKVKKSLAKEDMANVWLLFVSLLGMLGANSYRRSHKYYITNRRVIIRFGFLVTRERDLLYGKIEDLILHRDVLGKLFNFGTLIPISASGIGTGSDQAILMVGAEQKLPVGPSLHVTMGGGHSVTVPRAPSFYSLYGIRDPESLRTLMLREMERREYIRRKEIENTLQ